MQCTNPEPEKGRYYLRNHKKKNFDYLSVFIALPQNVKSPSDNAQSPEKVQLGKLLFTIQFYLVKRMWHVLLVITLLMVMQNIEIYPLVQMAEAWVASVFLINPIKSLWSNEMHRPYLMLLLMELIQQISIP